MTVSKYCGRVFSHPGRPVLPSPAPYEDIMVSVFSKTIVCIFNGAAQCVYSTTSIILPTVLVFSMFIYDLYNLQLCQIMVSIILRTCNPGAICVLWCTSEYSKYSLMLLILMEGESTVKPVLKTN